MGHGRHRYRPSKVRRVGGPGRAIPSNHQDREQSEFHLSSLLQPASCARSTRTTRAQPREPRSATRGRGYARESRLGPLITTARMARERQGTHQIVAVVATLVPRSLPQCPFAGSVGMDRKWCIEPARAVQHGVHRAHRDARGRRSVAQSLGRAIQQHTKACTGSQSSGPCEPCKPEAAVGACQDPFSLPWTRKGRAGYLQGHCPSTLLTTAGVSASQNAWRFCVRRIRAAGKPGACWSCALLTTHGPRPPRSCHQRW